MSTASAMPSIEMAVQRLASSFADAWNSHDPKALASFFAEDGDLINPAGRAAFGRKEIEALFADDHSKASSASVMSQTVTRVRMLTPEFVVTTNQCHLTGMRLPNDQTTTVDAIATMVLKNEGGGWRIVSARPMVPVSPPK